MTRAAATLDLPAGDLSNVRMRIISVCVSVALVCVAVSVAQRAGAATPGAVYLPNVTKTLGGPGGWTTPIVVQNTGTGSTSISVALYRFSDGAPVATLRSPTLTAGQGWYFDLGGLAQVPGDTQFAAVVTAASGSATAMVIEGSASQGWMAYSGTSGGGPTLYLPNITRRLGGPDGWTTPFIVQNLGAASTTATVSFYRFGDGSLARRIEGVAIQPGRSASFVPQIIDGLSDDAQYSVVVQGSAGAELYAIVNEHQGGQAMSYEGILAGAQNVYLPYVQKYVGGTGGWSSPFIVQNVGTTSATFSLSFYSVPGGALSAQAPSITLEPGRSYAADVRFTPVSLPAGEHSVVIRGNAGAKLAAIVNQQQLTTGMAMSYVGVTDSALAAYAPYVAKRAGNEEWNSGIVLQNQGTAPTDVRVQIVDLGDGSTKQTKILRALAPGASAVYSIATESPSSFLTYSAVISADQPVAAVVNSIGSGSGDMAMSYVTSAVRPAFPLGADPARTGVTGTVKFTTGEPAPGQLIRAIDWRGPGDARPARTYGSATTASDGTYTIVSIPPGTEYGIEYPDGIAAFYQQYPIVANSIVRLPELAVTRRTALTPTDGSTVAAGPLTISWSSVSGAGVYCLSLYDETAGRFITRGTFACGNAQSPGNDGPEPVTATSYAIIAEAGHHYFVSLLAYARTEFSMTNPPLASAFGQFTAR